MQSVTEQTHDYVCFFKDSSRTAFYGNERYSGPVGNWPSEATPLVIKANSFLAVFRSDGSNTSASTCRAQLCLGFAFHSMVVAVSCSLAHHLPCLLLLGTAVLVICLLRLGLQVHGGSHC